MMTYSRADDFAATFVTPARLRRAAGAGHRFLGRFVKAVVDDVMAAEGRGLSAEDSVAFARAVSVRAAEGMVSALQTAA